MRDPGLAPERTVLAWQRFSLLVAVIGALSLRAALVRHHSLVGFIVAAVLGAAAATLQLAGPRLEPARAVRLAQFATLAAAAGALAIALA